VLEERVTILTNTAAVWERALEFGDIIVVVEQLC
jgi:hypothetical protein